MYSKQKEISSSNMVKIIVYYSFKNFIHVNSSIFQHLLANKKTKHSKLEPWFFLFGRFLNNDFLPFIDVELIDYDENLHERRGERSQTMHTLQMARIIYLIAEQ